MKKGKEMSIKTIKVQNNIEQLQETKKEIDKIIRKLTILKLDVEDVINNETQIIKIVENK